MKKVKKEKEKWVHKIKIFDPKRKKALSRIKYKQEKLYGKKNEKKIYITYVWVDKRQEIIKNYTNIFS